MIPLPTEWSALCVIVFLLGMRHGLDADHLSTIDGLTRLSSRHGRRFSRYCGTLFSLGHGAVVIFVSISVGLLGERWTPPNWIDLLGTWISIAFLLLIGIVNLNAVFSAKPGAIVPVAGLKGRFFLRLVRADSALGVAGVGALFAVSFDTLSQATLFALAAVQFSGIANAVMLGLLFVLGMLITDGLNGWWIAHLISRADRVAALASRVMTVSLSLVSLIVAGLGVGKLASPALDRWSEGNELACGLTVTLTVAISYVAARWVCREAAAPRVRILRR